jgi:AmiR/NasT family two-component response regulator
LPSDLPADVDVVFFSVGPTASTTFAQAATGPGPSLIAIVDFENPTALRSLLDTNAHSFISKPIRASGILSSLVMARALQGYQNRLLSKVAKLEETLRSRREIERATRILMEVKGSSEDSAYQLIRQQATAQRLAMGVVARSIITAHRVFDKSVEDNTRIAREPRNTVLRMPARKSP